MRENIRRPGEGAQPTPGLAATPTLEGALAVGKDSESPANGVDEGLDAAIEAAELREFADAFERQADAIAIRYPDPEQRRKATAWYLRRVRELRAEAALLDQPTDRPAGDA